MNLFRYQSPSTSRLRTINLNTLLSGYDYCYSCYIKNSIVTIYRGSELQFMYMPKLIHLTTANFIDTRKTKDESFPVFYFRCLRDTE